MSYNRKAIHKFIVLGNSGCGKTCLLGQFAHKKFEKTYKATLGSDFLSVQRLIDDQQCTLQIWDTAGQERFQSLGPGFYRGADACLIVYDITDPESFKKLDHWRNDFLKNANVKDPENFPFVIVGNKVDLEKDRKVSKQTAQEWCRQKGGQKPLPYFETSAAQDIRVDDCFMEAARLALAQSSQEREDFIPETVNLNSQALRHPPPSSGCC